MRITPEILLKIARDTADERARADRSIIAIILSGSVLKGDPLIGGTTDIDLFFIYNAEITTWREIVRLTDDIHLDISHQPRSIYRHGKELRLHVWLGSTINGCKILYDPQHFMDFTQASVRSQYERPDTVLRRAGTLAEGARKIWLSFQREPRQPGPQDLASYLKAVEFCANAIACLSGAPLPERRILLEFPQRAEAVGKPGLYPGLLGLLGASNLDAGTMKTWIKPWQEIIQSLPKEIRPASLHANRIHYYRRAIEALLDSPEPASALWPLLATWTKAANLVPGEETAQAWTHTLEQLGIHGEAFEERLNALDAYLDLIEETLETWGQVRGAG